jgi:cell division protein FtsW
MKKFISGLLTLKGDNVFWGVIIGLLMVSLVMVYSATGTLAYLKTQNTASFLFKRILLMAICLSVMVFISNIHYRRFSQYSGLVLFFGVLGMLSLPIIGIDVNGSKRWIPFMGFTLQPSEFVKIGLIMYTSRILSLYQDKKHCNDKAFKIIGIASAIVLGLIFWSDFSSSALLGGTILMICYVGRVRLRLLLYVIGGILAALVLFISISLTTTLPGRIGTIQNRVLSFIGLNENEHSNDIYEFQIDQSKIAVATGGYIGKGPGNSLQRNFLPLPYSDFIFAVVVEEGGLATGLFIIFLYLTLMYKAGKIVYRSKLVFPALLCFGLTLGIVLQAFVNIGVVLGVFPITGQPLPLVSMGGSSLLFTCVSFGMLLSVTHQMELDEEAEKAEEELIN